MRKQLPLYHQQDGCAKGALNSISHIDSEMRIFRTSNGTHLFVVAGSRIYDLDPSFLTGIEEFRQSREGGLTMLEAVFQHVLETAPVWPDMKPINFPPPLYSISLNVAQVCNMSCHYCYADAGKFGGSSRMMKIDVARTSVDRLIEESSPHSRLLLGFMGGEPLLNREVIHEVTHYALSRASEAGKSVSFSITTNGTLLTPRDAELFSTNPFSVQLSIDGDKAVNDALRPMKDGTSSYDHVAAAINTFNHYGRPKHLAARVTVTPKSGALLPILDHLVSLGFDEVGFAPVLVSPAAEYAFEQGDFDLFLENMMACGRKALHELLAGRDYPFGNFITALQELHRGSHRPYPCGAGAAYLSVNAEGQLFACHRLIDDAEFSMGNVQHGSNLEARAAHLQKSHVDLMEPCHSCWARYLCGGGCYHEVKKRGRVACDYIRGWLEFCLKAYVELTTALPQCEVFSDENRVVEMKNPITL